MRKKVIFQINGGIGKCIAATAVCSAIKKKYQDCDLFVLSGYPEVFLNNPNVAKSLAFGTLSYFYQDYIENDVLTSSKRQLSNRLPRLSSWSLVC
jgi:hypothetical protein